MQNKRFIAGAVCPACSALDKIYTYELEQRKWRACVNCDFKEPFLQPVQHGVSGAQVEELATRVNQHRLGEMPLSHEVAVEKVNFLEPNKKLNDKK